MDRGPVSPAFLCPFPPTCHTCPLVSLTVCPARPNLKTLRLRLRRCHRFLPCENKSKAVEQIKNAFNKLQEKGIYKAMSEFDIFINYIEAYMTIKAR